MAITGALLIFVIRFHLFLLSNNVGKRILVLYCPGGAEPLPVIGHLGGGELIVKPTKRVGYIFLRGDYYERSQRPQSAFPTMIITVIK